jgi:predicted enzyme related to lactoylglutathione lyase
MTSGKTKPALLGAGKLEALLLFANDYDAMMQFYRDKLGLTVHLVNGGFAGFKANGEFLIMLHAGGTKDLKAKRPLEWFLRFRVDDIESTVAELIAAGVAVGPVRHESWGSIATLLDPEGNTIGIEQYAKAR